MSVKISIPGGNGRMGKTLIREFIENESLELAYSSCLPGDKEKGLDLGTLVGHNPINKILTDNPSTIFQDTDVIIDFTVPEASILHVEQAATYKIPIVIGTTGFNPSELDLIQHHSQHIPICMAPNMSVGVNVLISLVEKAAALLPEYDFEVVEAHHKHKVDAPSGTALRLGQAAADGLKISLEKKEQLKTF